jgi:hypothetical protein
MRVSVDAELLVRWSGRLVQEAAGKADLEISLDILLRTHYHTKMGRGECQN